MTRSTKEIHDQLSKAQTYSSQSQSSVPGMSYEEGVESALRWVLGESDEAPVKDEYEEDSDDES